MDRIHRDARIDGDFVRGAALKAPVCIPREPISSWPFPQCRFRISHLVATRKLRSSFYQRGLGTKAEASGSGGPKMKRTLK
jgi:hypothetical protein